jgi:hypothetical protein
MIVLVVDDRLRYRMFRRFSSRGLGRRRDWMRRSWRRKFTLSGLSRLLSCGAPPSTRAFAREIPQKTSQPEQTPSNPLIRDQSFGEELAKEADALRLRNRG